jgi:O-antigen ligase
MTLHSIKTKLLDKPEYIFLAFFVFSRIISLLTYNHALANQLVALALILGYLYISYKNISHAWLVLIAELLLDGSGHFFEFQGLILRTWFLIIFACFWGFGVIKKRKLKLQLHKPIKYTLLAAALVVLFATINGFIQDHSPVLIIQDTILYAFLALVFPAQQFRDITRAHIKAIIWTFIVGSFLFSAITFIIYSSDLGQLPDLYYHWFRNIGAGKITDLGNYFFRIVLPEHLFLVPLILIFVSKLVENIKSKQNWIALALLFTTLILNFTRIYFIAMAFGFLVLAIKKSFSKWFRVSTISVLLFVTLLISISFVSSRFQSVGLELIGIKVAQIRAPETDLSGAIRLAMLPDIFNTIKTHPLIGSGLATMVTYPDPRTHELVSRTQFDWGYFEMIAELGMIGTLIFLGFIILFLRFLAKVIYTFDTKKRPLYVGLFAGAISLFVVNITTPALFQGFGLLYFVYLMSLDPNDVSLQ